MKTGRLSMFLAILKVVSQASQHVKCIVFSAQAEHAVEIGDRRAIEFSFDEQSEVIKKQDLDSTERVQARDYLMPSDGTGAAEIERASAHAGIGLKYLPRVANNDVEREGDEAHRRFRDVRLARYRLSDLAGRARYAKAGSLGIERVECNVVNGVHRLMLDRWGSCKYFKLGTQPLETLIGKKIADSPTKQR